VVGITKREHGKNAQFSDTCIYAWTKRLKLSSPVKIIINPAIPNLKQSIRGIHDFHPRDNEDEAEKAPHIIARREHYRAFYCSKRYDVPYPDQYAPVVNIHFAVD
jgi:hypothetical protein